MEKHNVNLEATKDNDKQTGSSHKPKAEPPSLTSSFSDRIQFLQMTIGNHSVERLIRSGALQAKLSIGRAGDEYEREADRVADQVMRMPEQEPASMNNIQVQRACPGCEENELRRQPVEEEEEKLQRQAIEEDEEKKLQRQPEEEEDKIQAKGYDSGSEANLNIENQIQSIKGGGQPLSEKERAFFEPRFGYDFSAVKLHTDSAAAETAKAVNAQAYTTGRDIVFGKDKYSPESSEGKKLLAHELTHIVQQNG